MVTQEVTPAMPKTPITPRRRPGMPSAVSDSGHREAGQLSSTGMGAHSRSAWGPRESGSGVGMPAMLRTPQIGRAHV